MISKIETQEKMFSRNSHSHGTQIIQDNRERYNRAAATKRDQQQQNALDEYIEKIIKDNVIIKAEENINIALSNILKGNKITIK